MLESTLKSKVLKMLRQEFPDIWVYKASDRWQSGIPDLIICAHGRFIAIELKSEEGQTTKLQEYVLKCIRAAGGVACVARSVDEVRQTLKEARCVAIQ